MSLRHTTRRVLITGGAGFIGSHLAEKLLDRGDRVRIFDNMTTGRLKNLGDVVQHANVDIVTGDVGDADLVGKLVGESDVVFHLAAAVGVKLILADAIGSFRTNVVGTENVLAAAAHNNTKVLLASTSEVYGKTAKLPQAENDDVVLGSTAVSRWSYAAQKMLDEFVGLAYHRRGVPVVIFRLFNTVGPRQTGRYGMVVPRFVDAALHGEPVEVYGDGNQSRCFLHVRDAVDAIIRLSDSERAVGHVFNVGSTESLTIRELAERVLSATASAAGLKRDVNGSAKNAIKYVPYDVAYPSGGYEDIRARVPDTRKIRRAIRWRPRFALDDILRDVIEEKIAVVTPVVETAPVAVLA